MTCGGCKCDFGGGIGGIGDMAFEWEWEWEFADMADGALREERKERAAARETENWKVIEREGGRKSSTCGTMAGSIDRMSWDMGRNKKSE
jgi:hypothetical protein